MLCLPPFYKLKLENNSIQKLIFWSDNFYSMFVPSLPSLYQGPLTRRGYTDTVSTDTTLKSRHLHLHFSILHIQAFRVHRELEVATVSTSVAINQREISRGESSHYGKCSGARPGTTRLKFNHQR